MKDPLDKSDASVSLAVAKSMRSDYSFSEGFGFRMSSVTMSEVKKFIKRFTK